MSSPRQTIRVPRALGAGVLVGLLVGLSGCSGGPQTHPVRGKVEMPPEMRKKLLEKEAAIHFRLDSDKNVQASGTLQPDGTFEVLMLHKGKMLNGAVAGTYSACLSFDGRPEPERKNDDDPPVIPPISKSIVPYRYLTFEGSKWTLTVPTSGDVTFKVEAK